MAVCKVGRVLADSSEIMKLINGVCVCVYRLNRGPLAASKQMTSRMRSGGCNSAAKVATLRREVRTGAL